MGGWHGVIGEKEIHMFRGWGLLEQMPVVEWRLCGSCKGSGNKYPEYIKNNCDCPNCGGRGTEEIVNG